MDKLSQLEYEIEKLKRIYMGEPPSNEIYRLGLELESANREIQSLRDHKIAANELLRKLTEENQQLRKDLFDSEFKVGTLQAKLERLQELQKWRKLWKRKRH